MTLEIPKFPHTFFNFQCDYDLNLCRYLNPELLNLVPPMRDLASLYFLSRHTFVLNLVCATLFRRINPNYIRNIAVSAETKLHILQYKSAKLAENPTPRIRKFTMKQFKVKVQRK